jgi:hypothetical protein
VIRQSSAVELSARWATRILATKLRARAGLVLNSFGTTSHLKTRNFQNDMVMRRQSRTFELRLSCEALRAFAACARSCWVHTRAQ